MTTVEVYPSPATTSLERAAVAPLVSLQERKTPLGLDQASDQVERRKSSRRKRNALKQLQRSLTPTRTSRFCWHTLGAGATVNVGSLLMARVSGVQRCGSPWACPVCAPVVRERRAQEIDRGLSAWVEAGHGAEFVTLTVRHHLGDGLEARMAVLTKALGLVLAGAPWKRRAARLGYVGAIRALEVTWGRNGWHPHVHAVLLFDKPLTEAERADLAEWMFGRWGGICERKGFGSISRRHGVDVRPVVTAGDVASYLTKVDGGWGAGLELARSDVKRSAGGFNPWQILGELLETGESCWAARLLEYEAATFARRAIVWSPGLRARLLGDEAEETDEALAAAEGADLTLWRVLIERVRWNQVVSTGEVALVLDDIEAAAAVSLLLSRLFGREPEPLEGGT